MIAPRILVFSPKLKSHATGVSLAISLASRAFVKAGHKVDFIDTTPFGDPSKPATITALRAIEIVIVLARLLRKLRGCSVLYASMSTSKLGFLREFVACALAKHIFGVSVVLHLHGGGFEAFYSSCGRALRQMITWHLANTDKLILLSERITPQFQPVIKAVAGKITCVPNGLTLDTEARSRRPKHCSPYGPVRLLYMSSLIVSKGYLDVIAAFKILQSSHPNRFSLDICGNFCNSPSSSAKEEAEAREHFASITNLPGARWHGQVNGDLKNTLLSRAHFFVLPTYYPLEGQPLSIIEALAHSTPVISCEHRGIPDMIIHDINGALVPSHSPNDIAQQLVRLAHSPENYARLSKNARHVFEERFTQKQHIARLLAVIAEATSIKPFQA